MPATVVTSGHGRQGAVVEPAYVALARSGEDAALTGLYRERVGDMDRVIGDALARADAFVAQWIGDPPQTNEVGRTAATMAALMVLRRRFPVPVELLELGASAGLNLNLAHYAHDLGGVAAGDTTSPVRVAPEWRGSLPVAAPVEIAALRGEYLAIDATGPDADIIAHPLLAQQLGHGFRRGDDGVAAAPTGSAAGRR